MFALLFATLLTLADDTSKSADSDAPKTREIRVIAEVADGPAIPTKASDRLWLGVSCADIPEPLKKQLQLKSGVLIQSIADDSPASAANLRPYDVLTSLDGAAVATVQELVTLVQKTDGRRVQLEFRRAGQSNSLAIQATHRPRQKVPMVMVGPDGTPVSKDSEAMLKSLSENETDQAYSILVVHPGVVMPKEKLSREFLDQKTFEVHWKTSDLRFNHPALLAGRLSDLPPYPSLPNPPVWSPRVDTGSSLWLQQEPTQLFPESVLRTDSVIQNIEHKELASMTPPGPKLRVIRLNEVSNSQQHEYRLEVETKEGSEIDALRARTEMLEQELLIIREQLAAMQNELHNLRNQQSPEAID